MKTKNAEDIAIASWAQSVFERALNLGKVEYFWNVPRWSQKPVIVARQPNSWPRSQQRGDNDKTSSSQAQTPSEQRLYVRPIFR